MEANSKAWNTTRTGFKVHAFKDGRSLCRYKCAEGPAPAHAKGTARRWVLDTTGLSFCVDCEYSFDFQVKEDAWMAERREASHAEALAMNEAAAPWTCGKCDHAPMYHGGRGCDECVCTAPRNCPTNTPDDKEETVTIPLTGTLTERQTDILDYMAKGHRYQKIGTLMGLSVHQVKLEAHALIKKMGAQTAAHALATYATAQAYSNAAAQVRSGKIWAPGGEVDEHVNHVLDGIADLFKDWSDQRMPK